VVEEDEVAEDIKAVVAAEVEEAPTTQAPNPVSNSAVTLHQEIAHVETNVALLM
jgi:hypothetical protein